MSWLLSSISASMIRIISKCQHANELWITLEKKFLSESRSQLLHVKSLMQNTKKNDISINEYFEKIERVCWDTSFLGPRYNWWWSLESHFRWSRVRLWVITLNSTIESRYDKPTIQDAQYLSQKHELRLVRAQQSLNSVVSLEFHGTHSASLVKSSDRSTESTDLVTTPDHQQKSPSVKSVEPSSLERSSIPGPVSQPPQSGS